MNQRDYLNLSVDMRRIALWLSKGNEVLVEDFLKLIKTKFGNDRREVEGRKLCDWIKRINDYKSRGWKSAEDALTLSVMLKNRFAD